MTGFPADLPDLLRVTCSAQGRIRLHGVYSAENGWQMSLANSGQGWTVDHRRDPLEAMEAVLRQRYGKTLERERAEDGFGQVGGAPQPEAVDDPDSVGPEDIVRAVLDVICKAAPRLLVPEPVKFAEQVAEQLFPPARPVLHEETPPAPEVDDFEALL